MKFWNTMGPLFQKFSKTREFLYNGKRESFENGETLWKYLKFLLRKKSWFYDTIISQQSQNILKFPDSTKTSDQ